MRLWRSDTLKSRSVAGLTDRYLEVRYEALKSDGPRKVDEILTWLGLKSDLSFCERPVEASSIDRMKGIASAQKGFFRKGETDSWKSDLKPSDVRTVEFIAGDLMDALGYERTHPAGQPKPLNLIVEEQMLVLRAGAFRIIRGTHAGIRLLARSFAFRGSSANK